MTTVIDTPLKRQRAAAEFNSVLLHSVRAGESALRTARTADPTDIVLALNLEMIK